MQPLLMSAAEPHRVLMESHAADASEGGATIDEEITLAARKAAQVLTHSLFPGKKAEDIITQEELEAAGIADVTDRVSTTEDLKARIAAEEELPEKLVKSFEDAIRGSGRSVEAVFKALEDAHRATDDKPDTEESIGSSLGSSNAGSVEVAEEVPEVVEVTPCHLKGACDIRILHWANLVL